MDAAIYVRISQDTEHTGLGVSRQLDDCRAEANRRGWTVVESFVDNDVSATRSKPRPQYERMLTAVRSGTVKAVIVWDVDRLTRTPRELEDIIDLADTHGLSLANIGGEIDLSTAQGRMTARIKGSVARHDTDQQSRRLKRKFEDKALKGEPHGFAPYGFMRVYLPAGDHEPGGPKDMQDPKTAPIVAEAARRLLAGESLRSITANLNARGIPGPRSPRWNSTVLRQILQRPTNAGLRSHRGVIVGQARVEPIYDQDTHDRLTALFADPKRRASYQGSTPKHLLSGIALCGACGGTMRRLRGIRNPKTGKQQPAAYSCNACFGIRRKQELVDAVVIAHMLERLQHPDALQAMAEGDPGRAKEAADRVQALEAKLLNTADMFENDEITGAQLKRLTAKLRPQLEDAKLLADTFLPVPGLIGLTGPDAGERWNEAPLERKRALIQALMTVTIMPAGIGKGRDPELIRIQFKN
ncbi:recombinase family protein [Paeniglutamicibacter sp.]|uniref:recombinase family protein n=1 Tax=Paeniglutamicibacter sp. TaxID=1934391 RepID=UPI003989B9D1